MKYALKSLILAVSVCGLAACESMGDQDTAPPYAQERTATHESAPAPAPAPVQTPAPAPAPQCKACEDCSAWEARALQAEKDLATCQEATSRVRDAYRDELKK